MNVAQTYPDYPDAAKAGFEGIVDTSIGSLIEVQWKWSSSTGKAGLRWSSGVAPNLQLVPWIRGLTF
jgi:hypothetical protein